MSNEAFQTGLLLLYTIVALAAVASTFVSYFLLRRASEPHVVVYTKHDKDRQSLLLLVIENVGKGMAYDVSFELSRPIPMRATGLTPTGEEKDFEPMDAGPLIEGIPALAARADRVMTWGQYGGLMDALEGGSVKVTSRFESRGPYLMGPKEREVDSVLEVRSYKKTDASSSPERNAVKALETVAKGIKDIASVMKERGGRARLVSYLQEQEEEVAADDSEQG